LSNRNWWRNVKKIGKMQKWKREDGETEKADIREEYSKKCSSIADLLY
jgi:hypothetical protein